MLDRIMRWLGWVRAEELEAAQRAWSNGCEAAVRMTDAPVKARRERDSYAAEVRQLRTGQGAPKVEDVRKALEGGEVTAEEARTIDNLQGNRVAFQMARQVNKDIRHKVGACVDELRKLDKAGKVKIDGNEARERYVFAVNELAAQSGRPTQWRPRG